MRVRHAVLVALALVACKQEAAAPSPAPPSLAPKQHAEVAPKTVAAKDTMGPLPLMPATRFSPSHVQAPTAIEAKVDQYADVEQCAPCHQDVVAQWKESAHAHTSFNNPWYRGTVERFRKEQGHRESRFCAGCHDPLLLLDGAIDKPIKPEQKNISVGVTCLVCHSVSATSADGNGSYALVAADPLIPDPADEASVQKHVARLTGEPLRTLGLCGSCHRSFAGEAMGNPHHLLGINDSGSFRASPFDGSFASVAEHRMKDDPAVTQSSCRGCHMPMEDAAVDMAGGDTHQVASHRVAGGHRFLASQVSEKQEQRVIENLQGAASIDVAAVRIDDELFLPSNSGRVTPNALNQLLTATVVVRNQRVGHRFPGGTRDIQDTWVAVKVIDNKGAVIAQAGVEHETKEDPSAFVLQAWVLDENGSPERGHAVHRFRAAAFDRTIAPRQAVAVRYRVNLRPLEEVQLPLRIEATLRHRRHNKTMHALGCATSKSSFAKRMKKTIDGCASDPVTDVATTTVTLMGKDFVEVGSEWQRLCDLGQGLSHQTQERLEEARAVLMEAIAVAKSPEQVAYAQALLGHVAGRQGRTKEAVDLVKQAQEVMGEHPALFRIMGDAYVAVWRFDDAVTQYRRVVELAPFDVRSHRDLARALASSGDDEAALTATWPGLALQPRHPDLLRTQALSLRGMGASNAAAFRVLSEQHQDPDNAAILLRRCQESSTQCARDRQPVPLIPMTLLP